MKVPALHDDENLLLGLSMTTAEISEVVHARVDVMSPLNGMNAK